MYHPQSIIHELLLFEGDSLGMFKSSLKHVELQLITEIGIQHKKKEKKNHDHLYEYLALIRKKLPSKMLHWVTHSC